MGFFPYEAEKKGSRIAWISTYLILHLHLFSDPKRPIASSSLLPAVGTKTHRTSWPRWSQARMGDQNTTYSNTSYGTWRMSCMTIRFEEFHTFCFFMFANVTFCIIIFVYLPKLQPFHPACFKGQDHCSTDGQELHTFSQQVQEDVLHYTPRNKKVKHCFICVKLKKRHLSIIFEIFLWEKKNIFYEFLVGGFNPSEKYARQHGNLPQFSGWK